MEASNPYLFDQAFVSSFYYQAFYSDDNKGGIWKRDAYSSNYGWRIKGEMGMPPNDFAKDVRANNAVIVGVSALMSTTVNRQRK